MKSFLILILTVLIISSSFVNAENSSHPGTETESYIVKGMRYVRDDITAGKTDKLEEIIKFEADLNKFIIIRDQYEYGRLAGTLLHAAVMSSNKEAIKILLENGADIEMRTNLGDNALFLAVYNDNLDIAKILVDSGAYLFADKGYGGDIFSRHNMQYVSSKMRAYLLEVKSKYTLPETAAWVSVNDYSVNIHGRQKNLNFDKLKKYMKNSNDFSGTDAEGDTIVHCLAKERKGHEYIKTLVAGGNLDVNLTNRNGQTALHYACRKDCVDNVKALVEAGADVNVRDYTGNTPLLTLALYYHSGYPGDFEENEIAKILIEKGADVNAQNVFGVSCLHKIVDKRHQTLRKTLIDGGGDVNLTDNKFETPLHEAARNGSIGCVKAYLEAGAICDLTNLNNKTPIDCVRRDQEKIDLLFSYLKSPCLIQASIFSQDKYIDKLSAAGADIEHTHPGCHFGATALIISAKKNSEKIVKKLLELGANINAADSKGNTALHYAAQYGKADALWILLEAKADITIVNKEDKTAFDLARSNNKFRVIQLFKDMYPEIEKSTAGVIKQNNTKTISSEGIIKNPDKAGESLDRISAAVKKKQQAAKAKYFVKMTDKPLHKFVITGNVERVKRLLESDRSIVKETDRAGVLPTGYATLTGNQKMLELLIEYGADIDQVDKNAAMHLLGLPETNLHTDGKKAGFGILHYAVADHNYEMVDFITGLGADIKIIDTEFKRTPMVLAYELGDFDMIKKLAEAGGDLKIQGRKMMMKAAKSGKIKTVKKLLALGIDLDRRMLLEACKWDKDDMAVYLLENGADINVVDSKGNNILHHVISDRNTEIVRLLIEYGIDVNHKNKEGLAPIFTLGLYGRKIKQKQFNHVNMLIDAGADVSVTDKNGNTLIHYAIRKQSYSLFEFAVKKGCNPNKANNKGRTPMMILMDTYSHSGGSDKEKMIKLLVKHGADLSFKNKYGQSYLHNAVDLGMPEVIKCLIENGFDVNSPDKKNRTPLHIAGSRKDGGSSYSKRTMNQVIALNIDMIKILLEAGADIHARNNSNDTPLHAALRRKNHRKIIECLISNGADINAKSQNGYSPLHTAISNYNDVDNIDCLIAAGADINIQDNGLYTPVHYAIFQRRNPEYVKRLIAAGADTNIANKYGRTPLDTARRKNNQALIEMLEKQN